MKKLCITIMRVSSKRFNMDLPLNLIVVQFISMTNWHVHSLIHQNKSVCAKNRIGHFPGSRETNGILPIYYDIICWIFPKYLQKIKKFNNTFQHNFSILHGSIVDHRGSVSGLRFLNGWHHINLYFLAERQEIKGRQSSLSSLEEPRIKGQTIQFRQTALSTPYYVHIWYLFR